MAKLFDPKQDVIDIQLTQYGKYLLSKGQMRPDSYAFFDNDIIYDGLYANVSESQNEAQDRIKNKTVRVRPQYVFRGIETDIKNNIQQTLNSKIDLHAPALQPTADKAYSLNDPIGTCDTNSENVPVWNAKFLKAPLSASSMYPTSDVISPESNEEQEQTSAIISSNYLDGSYFIGQHDYLFLDVTELNTYMGSKNFDIEVFEIETEEDTKTGANKEILRQLHFFPEQANNMGMSSEEVLSKNFPVLNSSYVGYYFYIDVDDEIGDRIFCEAQTKFKKIDLFSDSDREIQCFDIVRDDVNLYGETVQSDEECN